MSTFQIGRRKLLGFLAATPVAMREAAKAAGVSDGLSSGGAIRSYRGGPISDDFSPPPDIGSHWATKALKNVVSGGFRSELEREWRVSILDPDLASSRSFSLSAAMRIQRNRDIERQIASHRTYLEGVLVDEFGIGWSKVLDL